MSINNNNEWSVLSGHDHSQPQLMRPQGRRFSVNLLEESNRASRIERLSTLEEEDPMMLGNSRMNMSNQDGEAPIPDALA